MRGGMRNKISRADILLHELAMEQSIVRAGSNLIESFELLTLLSRVELRQSKFKLHISTMRCFQL